MENLTELFKDTKSKLIKSSLEKGGVVLGTKIEGFKGKFFAEEKEYAGGLARKIEKDTEVKGFISTDELPKYGISKEERKSIEEKFETKEEDIVLLVVETEDKAKKAMELIEDEIDKRKLFEASGPFIE